MQTMEHATVPTAVEIDGMFEVLWYIIAPDVERLMIAELTKLAASPAYEEQARAALKAFREHSREFRRAALPWPEDGRPVPAERRAAHELAS